MSMREVIEICNRIISGECRGRPMQSLSDASLEAWRSELCSELGVGALNDPRVIAIDYELSERIGEYMTRGDV